MEQIVAGCVQLRIRLPEDKTDLEQHLLRFARLAQTKRTRLLIFPQYSGLMAAALVTSGARSGLLRQADRARRVNASFWTRAQAKLAGGAAGMLGADFGRALEGALIQRPEEVREAVVSLFGSIASHHGMVVVAGTAYLPDADGAVRHTALVFGPDGRELGGQSAVTLAAGEHPIVEAGQQWQAIDTPIGRLGILIGYDMLYPEAGRVLAYGGAEVLVGLGATGSPATYARQRAGLMARVEDNQLFGAMSFAVGYNPFTPADQEPFFGRSLLAAPCQHDPAPQQHPGGDGHRQHRGADHRRVELRPAQGDLGAGRAGAALRHAGGRLRTGPVRALQPRPDHRRRPADRQRAARAGAGGGACSGNRRATTFGR